MADPTRDELESEIGRQLGKLFKAQMGRLLELMGDPPNLGRIPDSFWEEAGQEFTQIVRPFLKGIFERSAEKLTENIQVGVDWTLVNEAAAQWASQYTYDLVRGVNSTSRDMLQRAVSSYYRDALTRGELEERLAGIFGPKRAENIAVTEVTRASARGEDAAVNLLAEEGIVLDTFWNTNHDELVCPTCGPLNGKKAAERENGVPFWVHPKSGKRVTIPAHPRCRCNENNRIPR